MHIDSHYDLYCGNNYIWIDNYLRQTISDGIVRSIFLVAPDHFFIEKSYIVRFIMTIEDIISYKKKW